MKLKQHIKECIDEIVKEDLNIPSRDGTANGASEDDKQKAKQATQNGKSVDFVKPGDIEESHEDGVRDVEEAAIDKDEAHQKVVDVYQTLSQASSDIAELEDFANESGNAKMKKMTVELSKHIEEANKIIGQLKILKETHLAEEAEEASSFGDKVMKVLSKHFKKDGAAESMKKKYMPFIHKAFQKGKSAKEVADRIKDHRFEI